VARQAIVQGSVAAVLAAALRPSAFLAVLSRNLLKPAQTETLQPRAQKDTKDGSISTEV